MAGVPRPDRVPFALELDLPQLVDRVGSSITPPRSLSPSLERGRAPHPRGARSGRPDAVVRACAATVFRPLGADPELLDARGRPSRRTRRGQRQMSPAKML